VKRESARRNPEDRGAYMAGKDAYIRGWSGVPWIGCQATDRWTNPDLFYRLAKEL
jgi:hypothetical protein